MNHLRGTAEHEAGHAMMARYFGIRVLRCEVRSDGSGLTVLAPSPSNDADEMVKCAVVAAAGPALDALYGRRSDCEGDHEQVQRFTAEYTRLTGQPMSDPYRAARALLQGRIDFAALIRLADVLETGRVLTGSAITDVVIGRVRPTVIGANGQVEFLYPSDALLD